MDHFEHELIEVLAETGDEVVEYFCGYCRWGWIQSFVYTDPLDGTIWIYGAEDFMSN